MRLHFSIGGYDYRRTARFSSKYPFQHHSSPFLLIMCIDAPKSTTNSRSSGLRVDAGRHLFSEGEKNVALSCSVHFNTLLDSFHAASRAPCSCHFRLLLIPILKFWSVGATLMRFTWATISERRILVSNFSVTRAIASVNFTRWIGFRMSVHFRRIDFGVVMS